MSAHDTISKSEFTDQHRESVCKIGQGPACCRYVTMGADGWGCAKNTSMRPAIDARAEQMNAKGDNCGGLAFGEDA